MSSWKRAARGVGVVIVVALLGGLPIVDSVPAGADELPTVPGLESPPTELDPPTIPEGVFSQPPGPAGLPALPDDPTIPGAPAQPGPVVTRTASSTVYDNGDGSSTVRLHNSLVNYQDELGVWRAIDTRVVADTTAGAYKLSSGPFDARFAGATGDGATILEVADDDWSIGFKPTGLTAGRSAEVTGSTVRYPGVGTGTDLVFKAGTDRVKETIRLNQALPLGGVPHWRSQLVLEGVTPSVNEKGSIVFADDEGTTVAEVPVGVATDSSHKLDAVGLTPRTPVRPLLLPNDSGWVVELLVDPAWLLSPERVYPVYIDPTVVTRETRSDLEGVDVVVGSGCGNCRYNGGGDLTAGGQTEEDLYVDKIGRETYTPPGTNATGEWEWRSLLYYNFGPLLGRGSVRSASLELFYFDAVPDAYPIDFQVRPLSTTWSYQNVNWDNQPAVRPEIAGGNVRWADDEQSIGITPWVQNWLSGAWPYYGMKLQRTADRLVRMAAMEEAPYGLDPYVEVVLENRVPYHTREQLVPAHGSSVTTSNPTLSAPALSDPEGDPLEYWFRVATGSDGDSGVIVDSGWLGTPSFTPPPGSLADGVYYWKIYTRDRYAGAGTAPLPAELRIDRRLGTSGPSPYDTVGPVTVNLATGNAVVTAAAPRFSSVGGPIGLDLTYNSLAGPNAGATKTTGLLGKYVDDADAQNSFIRRDPNLNFTWSGSPGGNVPATNYTATWTGYIRTPTPCFAVEHDDGAKVWLNNALVFDQPTAGTTTFTASGLAANQPVPIKVELRQGPGTAKLKLWYFGNCSTQFAGIVPSDWLSSDAGVLPDRWTTSLADGDLLYARATVNDNAIVLVEPGGEIHQYAKQPDGTGWRPTNVDDDVVTTATEGGALRVVVGGADGLTYTFDGAGRLVRVRNTLDDDAPASAEYDYDPATGNLMAVTDPLSGRNLTLLYAPASGGAGSCLTTGFATPPAGMLCQLTHPDATTTKLFYNANRQLARIENPGGQITDFAYDSGSRLSAIRDPLAYDAVAAPAPLNWPNDDTTRTLIAYQASGQKTQSVTAPVAMKNDTTRLGRTYTYVSGGETHVNVAGIAPPDGRTFARKVTFDSGGRGLTETGLDNLTASQEWESAADRILAATDTTGRKTTTLYDHAGRPTDVYGPAPASWFGADRRPTSGHVADVPHTTTAYDEGMRGLAAEFWDNETFSGPAKTHALGVGRVTGTLWKDWGTGGPAGLGTSDHFSARFTGEITFPAAGYRLTSCGDDGTRVWVDDVRVIDAWNTVGCGTSTWTSPGDGVPRRIRVEMREATGNSDVHLDWTPPGGSQVFVPGQYLGPRYGLVTSTVDADGKKTATHYAAPETGLATATVVDPDGARLTTEVGYEPTGTGYLRRLTRKLPAQAYDGQVRADGPAAYWRLGESVGPTAVDDSGNGRNATYPAAATLRQAGATGADPATLVDYDPITAGDVLDMAGTQAFTLEAWVKPDFNDTEWRRILSKETADANGRQGWLLWAHDGTFGFERFRDGVVDVVTGGSVTAGQWTHVAAAYGSSTVRLYVDGVQVASAAASRSLADTTAPLLIGDELYGAVDEVAVYTTELSATRIAAHRRAAHPYLDAVKADGAAAHWRLTETNGSTALDSSGNNRTATYQSVELGEPGLLSHDTAVRGWGSTGAIAGDVLDRAGTAAFSLEAWINPHVVDDEWRRLLSKEATDANGRQGWTVWVHEGTVGFERFRDDWSPLLTGGSVPAGTWTHVVVTYSGTTSRLYVNGVQVASVSDSRSLLDTTGSLLIGDNLVGRMTQAAVYPSALSAAKVAAHYRNGIADQGGTTTSYYGAAEARTNPCPDGTSALQSGLPSITYGADPDGSGTALGRAQETVYDVLGRVVATRIGTEAWSCTTYDARGRVKTSTFPAFGGEPARTITPDYAVGGDPLTSSVTDATGTITTTVDLLGRVVSHTDVWGKTTTTTYDQAGRVTQTNGPGRQVGTDYRPNGWVDAQRLAGNVIARPTYSAAGEPDGVSYPSDTGNRGNGTALALLRDTASGRTTKMTWSQAGGALLASDEVVHTPGGRVKNEVVDGADHHAGDDFAYDAAGRLTDAWIPGHTLTYAFSGTNSCGQSSTAGRNGNRTSVVDNTTTYTYCYDSGDKLTSTNDARYFSIAYDSRYNTTTLGDEALVYDGAGNHAATIKGTSTVRYVRDALGRIVERKVNGTTVARYSFGGAGDSPVAVLNAANTVVETTVPLVGGAVLTTRSTGDVWSYPNVHGDVMATANPAGAKVGSTLNYDPYGQALGGTPDNSAGNLDYGWLGQHQRGVETEAGIATIEMGARPYVPGLGRFLEVDPVEGGCSNDYVYVSDPVNEFDLDGTKAFKACGKVRIRKGGALFTIQEVNRNALEGWVEYYINFTAIGRYVNKSVYTTLVVRGKRPQANRKKKATVLADIDSNKRDSTRGESKPYYAHTTQRVRIGTELSFIGHIEYNSSPWGFDYLSVTAVGTCRA